MKKGLVGIIRPLLTTALLTLALGNMGAAATPWLHTSGNWILDANNNQVCLRGVSVVCPEGQTGSKNTNQVIDVVSDSTTGWYSRVVRLPICTTGNPSTDFALLDPIVQHCIAKGLYVVVDLHFVQDYGSGSGAVPQSQVLAFWNTIAPHYANNSNVIFEVFNEPINPVDWNTWKSYIQPVVDAIRSVAPNNLILMGSPQWSQLLNQAVSNQITGGNVVYVHHYYPIHGAPSTSLLDGLFGTAANTIPVVLGEFGWQNPGDAVTTGTTSAFGAPLKTYMEAHKNINWVAWVANNTETNWLPIMFDANWNILGGDNYQGQFIHDWLNGDQNDHQPSSGGAPPTPAGLTATAGNTQVALSWTASSGATAYDVKRSTISGSGYVTVTSPTTTSYTNTGLTNGTTYYFVVDAKSAGGTSGNSNQASATPAVSSGTTQVNLASSFNLIGIQNDGVVFSGGLDGNNAYSGNLLGTSKTWSSTPFTIGPAGANDAVTAAGQVISLPAGNFTSLKMLGTAVLGNQVNQTFTVKYTDASTTPFTQSLSDWASSQGYTGESQAVTMAYRNQQGTGTKQTITMYLYGYSFALNSAKTIQSITLPNNTNVKVLSITLTGSGGSPPPAPTSLAATPGNMQVALTWNASTGATAYDVKRSTVSGSGYVAVSSPTTISYTNTGLTNGTAYYFVVDAKNANGTSANSSQVSATPVGSVATQVNLTSIFNFTGVENDGVVFSGGLDGSYDYSGNLLGTSKTWSGATFTIGPAGANDTITCIGQVITLPAGNFSSLKMLATGIFGSQTSQTFTVKYTDASTMPFTQSLSDWAAPQSFTGESIAVPMTYRNQNNGTKQTITADLYGYSFALNNGKTVQSITLPNNANVKVLSITLAP